MSLFDSDTVNNLVSVYNERYPKERVPKGGDTDETWKLLKTRLQSKCKTGRAECIVASLLKRPKAPKEWALNRYEWLSSDDIDAIESNYEELFPDYHYVGTVPIDFDLKDDAMRTCIVSTLCSLNIKELHKKGKHRIGIVINTDPHDGPGQHWVCVYADIRPELEYPQMTYFDSYAMKPEPEIKRLMQRWKSQMDSIRIHPNPMKLRYNKTRHQYKDSECGMYCLYFHYACLMNIPMDESIPDNVINGFRSLLFRIPKIQS